MRYIDDAPITMSHLSKWANPRRIVFASHYFWGAGFVIQRSQEGLLRSLLYNLLGQAPELIVSLWGKWWKQSNAYLLPFYQWSLAELENLLHKVSELGELPIKFCFLVDGLDVFEGDMSSISRALLDLCRSADIKLCVASRPWTMFEDSLGRDPARKLYVHELTYGDIERYAKSRLFEHPRLSKSPADMELVERLATEITIRAEGVFLWVFLVTRLLREDLTNYDSVSDLWRRLESLPVDLELFFRHILSSVEPFYHEKMAGALRIVLRANGPLPLELFSYHDLEYYDEDYVLKQPLRSLNEEERECFHRPTSRRLNGWTKGLVETRHGRVEFLHRTVWDFLRTGSMNEIFEEKMAVGSIHVYHY